VISEVRDSWLSAVDQPEELLEAFGGEVPSADGIDIYDLALRCGDPSMSLRFTLASYPTDPPARWRSEHANAVQVQLTFHPIREIAVTRWGWRGIADLHLRRGAGGVLVRLEGPNVELDVLADWALMSLWPYIHRDR
jgi:hypothetical protein